MCSWVAGAKPSGGASLAWRPVSPEQRCVREGPGGQAGDESRGLEPGILTPLRVKPDWEALQEVTPVTREPWQPGPGGGGARGLMLGVSGDGFAERKNILMVANGIRGGGINWEIGIAINTPPYIK